MTKEQFIEEIAASVTKYCKEFGINPNCASAIIAQACLESGYGTSNKAKYNNFFGMKYRNARVTCNSGFFNDGGSEQKANGSYVPISTDWYAFETLDLGVKGYFQFISIDRYSNLKTAKTDEEYLNLIKADGYATSLNYVTNLLNVINNNNLRRFNNMSNSSLVTYTLLSPNHSGKRTHSIDRLTIHCFVGQVTAKRGAEVFQSTSRKASCNYCVGTDGISLVVDEANRSWCSSSSSNDQRAITIECASDTTAPYAFRDDVYQRLIDLTVDICKRNGKTKVIWISDKDKALAYEPKSNELLLTVHRWFAAKSCPGDWMYNRLGSFADTVNAKLNPTTVTQQPAASGKHYRVQVGYYSVKANAIAMQEKLKKLGIDSIIKEE